MKIVTMIEIDGEQAKPEDVFVVIGDIYHPDGNGKPAGGLIGPNFYSDLPPNPEQVVKIKTHTYLTRKQMLKALGYTPRQLRDFADELQANGDVRATWASEDQIMSHLSSIKITELPTAPYAIPRHQANIQLEGPGLRIAIVAEGRSPELAYSELKTRVAGVISTLYTLTNGYVEVTTRSLGD
jgi:hypothetical protein